MLYAGSDTYLHEVVSESRLGVVLEGLAEDQPPLVVDLIPVLPIAHMQSGLGVSSTLLMLQLDLHSAATHPVKKKNILPSKKKHHRIPSVC